MSILQITSHVPDASSYISGVLELCKEIGNAKIIETTLADLTKKEVAAYNNAPNKKSKKLAHEKLQLYYLAFQQCKSIEELGYIT